jgi:DNA-binding response OmpR family regulator
MRILIADDDDLAQRILRRYLESWGHEVIAVGDGAEAWALFQKEEIPIVISDWMMPNVDGLELIRRIRSHPRGAYVYTILVTARSDKEDLVRGMEAGADDFVAKPFDRDELRVRLREGERIVNLERALAQRSNGWHEDGIRLQLEEAEREIVHAAAQLEAIEGLDSTRREKLECAIGELKKARRALAALRESTSPTASAQPATTNGLPVQGRP